MTHTDFYTWSGDELSLTEFVEQQQHALPVVVQVTAGWLAESEVESFASGEVSTN